MHDLKSRLLKHASQEINPTLCIALREAAHRLAQLEAMHGATAAPKESSDEMYFLQDESAVVGNCAVWWAQGSGYTTKLDQARRFTKDEAFAQNKVRSTDMPWPCAVIEPVAHPTIDVQDMNRECRNFDAQK